MSIVYTILFAVGVFVAGWFGGMRHHAGQDAIATVKAQSAIDADRREQQAAADAAVAAHVTTINSTQKQLGAARVTIAKLTTTQAGTACLDADTVRVLDAIGAEPVRADTGSAASPPAAVATDSGNATAGEVAESIATCRAGYAAVADQLSKILDFDAARQKGAP